MVSIKVYICGSRDNEAQFYEAEEQLRAAGHIPINPIKIIHALPAEINNSEFTVIAFEIIRVCDAIYPLSGWKKDLVARMEVAQAKRTEKKILN